MECEGHCEATLAMAALRSSAIIRFSKIGTSCCELCHPETGLWPKDLAKCLRVSLPHPGSSAQNSRQKAMTMRLNPKYRGRFFGQVGPQNDSRSVLPSLLKSF